MTRNTLFLFIFFLVTINTWSKSALAQPSIIETVQNTLPSIVTIQSENAGLLSDQRPAAAFDKQSGRIIVLRNVKTAQYNRNGSGVIIDPRGIIATNAHIVKQSGRVTVTLDDKTEIPAKILGIIEKEDLALLHITAPHPLRVIEFADSDQIKLDDEVVMVGGSELLTDTISGGRIIGIGSHASEQQPDDAKTALLQVDMNLYRGDSGGPVFDTKGHLVGLIVAGQKTKDRSSFIIPSNQIKKRYLEFLSHPTNP
ncbi:MAG: trypsin-like peptidase domain-containing protein [Candidatus Omnitrophota bacterium]